MELILQDVVKGRSCCAIVILMPSMMLSLIICHCVFVGMVVASWLSLGLMEDIFVREGNSSDLRPIVFTLSLKYLLARLC